MIALKEDAMFLGLEKLNGVCVLTVSGRVDSSSDALESKVKALPPQDKQKILIDFSGVIHVDTKGLGQVISSHQDIMRVGGRSCWIILEKQTQVMETFRRTGLLKMLEVCKSVQDGLSYLMG